MRAILENVRSSEVSGQEVPQPELRPGGILVRTAFSAISAGTELAHREEVEKLFLGKALARPYLARQVVDFARSAGIKALTRRCKRGWNLVEFCHFVDWARFVAGTSVLRVRGGGDHRGESGNCQRENGFVRVIAAHVGQ
jgi:hypothetical protein